MNPKSKFHLEPFIISILIPLAVSMLSACLSSNSATVYAHLVKPFFAPPGIVFPIVWIFLYILMGISSYLIFISTHPDRKKALTVYAVQLVFNFCWSVLFFTFGFYLVSLVWLILLIILIVLMIILFFRINKTAAYLQIPYLLWSIYAACLAISIYILNSSKLLV